MGGGQAASPRGCPPWRQRFFVLGLRSAGKANRILGSGSGFYGHETDVSCVPWAGDKVGSRCLPNSRTSTVSRTNAKDSCLTFAPFLHLLKSVVKSLKLSL